MATRQYAYQLRKLKLGICIYGGCKEYCKGRMCRTHKDFKNFRARERRAEVRLKSLKTKPENPEKN